VRLRQRLLNALVQYGLPAAVIVFGLVWAAAAALSTR
jgi:hypothetical protein